MRGGHSGRDGVSGHLPDTVQHQVLCPPDSDVFSVSNCSVYFKSSIVTLCMSSSVAPNLVAKSLYFLPNIGLGSQPVVNPQLKQL